MIKKINVFIIVFMLTCFSLQMIAHSLSMAAFTENNHLVVKRGETGEFFILFWNPENESFPVRLKTTQIPEGLAVVVNPNDFMLDPSLVTEFPAEKSRNYINTKQGLMMTTPVKVLVKIPRTMELGSYDVEVTATVGNPSETVSTLLEKKFKFTVNVTSLTFFESLTQTAKDLIPEMSDVEKGITGMFTTANMDLRIVFVILTVMGIFVVVWIIRRH